MSLLEQSADTDKLSLRDQLNALHQLKIKAYRNMEGNSSLSIPEKVKRLMSKSPEMKEGSNTRQRKTKAQRKQEHAEQSKLDKQLPVEESKQNQDLIEVEIGFRNAAQANQDSTRSVKKFEQSEPNHTDSIERCFDQISSVDNGKPLPHHDLFSSRNTKKSSESSRTGLTPSKSSSVPRVLKKSILAQEHLQRSSLINDNPIIPERKTRAQRQRKNFITTTKFQEKVDHQLAAAKQVQLVRPANIHSRAVSMPKHLEPFISKQQIAMRDQAELTSFERAKEAEKAQPSKAPGTNQNPAVSLRPNSLSKERINLLSKVAQKTIPHYAELPSVRKQTRSVSKYALRNTLNSMEPQLLKYKTRKSARCHIQKQATSTFVAICTQHSENLYEHILSFVEGPGPAKGPGLHTFKVALLNRKMNSLVKEVYGVSSFRNFAMIQAKQDIIQILSSEPSYEKYIQDKRGIINLKRAWKNQVFGQSIFRPLQGAMTGIGGVKERRADGRRIEKPNALLQKICGSKLDDSGAGFYHLRNIKTSHDTFLDIQILISKGITDPKERSLIEAWHSKADRRIAPRPRGPDAIVGSSGRQASVDPVPKSERMLRRTVDRLARQQFAHKMRSQATLAQSPQVWTSKLRNERHASSGRTQPLYSDSHGGSIVAEPVLPKSMIKHLLNGFARVIEFSTTHIDKAGNFNPTVDPKANQVIGIAEGEFEEGQISGFVRCLDREGECKVGFWKRDTGSEQWEIPVSRPFGKFSHYYKDGSFKTPVGIYNGNDKVWNQMVVAKPIFDFLTNEQPKTSEDSKAASSKKKEPVSLPEQKTDPASDKKPTAATQPSEPSKSRRAVVKNEATRKLKDLRPLSLTSKQAAQAIKASIGNQEANNLKSVTELGVASKTEKKGEPVRHKHTSSMASPSSKAPRPKSPRFPTSKDFLQMKQGPTFPKTARGLQQIRSTSSLKKVGI